MFTKSFQLGRIQMSSCLPNTRQQLKCLCSLFSFPAAVCFRAPWVSQVGAFEIQYSAKGSAEVSTCILVLPSPHGLSVLGLYLLIAAALIVPNFDHCPLSSSMIFCLSSAPGHPSVLALDYQFQLSQQPQTLTFDSSTHLFTILCLSSAPWNLRRILHGVKG